MKNYNYKKSFLKNKFIKNILIIINQLIIYITFYYHL